MCVRVRGKLHARHSYTTTTPPPPSALSAVALALTRSDCDLFFFSTSFSAFFFCFFLFFFFFRLTCKRTHAVTTLRVHRRRLVTADMSLSIPLPDFLARRFPVPDFPPVPLHRWKSIPATSARMLLTAGERIYDNFFLFVATALTRPTERPTVTRNDSSPSVDFLHFFSDDRTISRGNCPT